MTGGDSRGRNHLPVCPEPGHSELFMYFMEVLLSGLQMAH
jgi:hypothetical protein